MKITKTRLSALLGCILFVSPYVHAAPPSAATLTLDYDGAGNIRITQTLNAELRGTCRTAMRGSVYYAGFESTRRIQTVRRASKIKSKVTVFRAGKLPAIVDLTGNNRAILSVQTQTTCQRGGFQVANIISNTVATYLTCGRSGRSDVSPGVFMTTLSKSLRD